MTRKSLLDRFLTRADKFDPIHPRDPGLSTLFGLGSGTSSGVKVTEVAAQNITSVYSAVGLVSETIAMLPWNVFKRLKEGGKEAALSDYRYDLIHFQPNRFQNSMEFREMVISQLMIRGRSVIEIFIDPRTGRISDLIPLPPDSYAPFFGPDGRQAMTVDMNGVRRVLLSDEFIDVRGHPHPTDPLRTLSPIQANAETLGISVAAADYAGTFFGNGTVVSGNLETKEALSENAYQRLKEWTDRHGGFGKHHKAAILEEGLTWKQTSLNANDSQLLETREFQIEEVARIFRIPSYKLGAMKRATFNNVEQQGLDFVVDSILPKTVRLETAVAQGIFFPNERRKFTTEIKIMALLRGDTKTRGEWYQKRWNMGSINANEIRELENENPIDGGDRYYVPVNFVPADKVDEMVANGSAGGNQNQNPNRSKPLVRSIFDRIVTAQCKIYERCLVGDRTEEYLTESFEKNKLFIDRNILPLIEAYGEGVQEYFNRYFIETLEEIKESETMGFLSDWQDFRASSDCDNFFIWLDVRKNGEE